MKTAVLLSGCGVYDGSEIHESVLTLLALSQNKMEYICVAPDINKHHVINHLNGHEMQEDRNVLYESARIARGDICKLSDLEKDDMSSLIITGGFGAAKNLSNWAFKGNEAILNQEVKDLILHCIEHKKPIVSLCISPVLIAKSLEESNFSPTLTLGSSQESSEYNISDIHDAISTLGSNVEEKNIKEICVDKELKIISAPCYMLNAEIDQVYLNISIAIKKLRDILK